MLTLMLTILLAAGATQVAADLSGLPVSTLKECAECPELVIVPAGEFMMGSVYDDAVEQPVHRVTIARPFAVGRYEVTRGEFAVFIRETGYDPGNSCWVYSGSEWEPEIGRSWRDPGYPQTDRDPVVCVSWDDAHAYAQWLNGKTGHGDDGPYRLPTEAEWEYAARAGTTTELSCGANSSCLEDSAWFFSNSGLRTHPVGEKAANAFGLHDTIGNVWEWVEDCWHDSYDGAPANGMAWNGGTTCARIIRGGAARSNYYSLRSAVRVDSVQEDRGYYQGFRIARALPEYGLENAIFDLGMPYSIARQ